MQWPESVTVVEPGMVGVGVVFYATGAPCCALGWAKRAGILEHHDLFLEAYLNCARALIEQYFMQSVAYTNDRMLDKQQRALVYNAAMAYLGYVVGQDSEAVKLAKKAKRLAKGK